MRTFIGRKLGIAVKINGMITLAGGVALLGAFLLLSWMQRTIRHHEQTVLVLARQTDLARRMQVDFKKQVQEWKDILLRGYNPIDLDRYRAQFFREETLVREEGAALSGALTDPDARVKLENFLQAHAALGLHYRQALDVFERGGATDFKAADRLVRGMDREPTDMLEKVVASIAQGFARHQRLDALQLTREERDAMLAITASFLATLVAGLAIARRLVRPIQHLTATLAKVSTERDYSVRATSCGDDELGQLTDGLNELLRHIQTQTADLKRSRQELADFVDNATEGLHMVGPDGRILWANQAELDMLGYSREEYVGQPISQFHVDPKIVAEKLKRVRSGEALYNYEVRLRCKDGSIRHALINSNALIEDGRLVHSRSYVRDITDLKHAEENLRRLNEELEHRVSQRAQQLEAVHRQLHDASRQAGMAEVATNVLHNVGNVLNSANVSVHMLIERARGSKVGDLRRVVEVLRQHEKDLGAFISCDLRGRHLLGYLTDLAEHLRAEQTGIVKETESLRGNVEHIREIVRMQQSYAKLSGVKEIVDVLDLVEDSVRLNAEALTRHHIEVIREFEDRPLVNLDKHRALQILINLVRNAKYACEESGPAPRRITLRVAAERSRVFVSVIDNGVGIPLANLGRLFTYGFTTRASGHGFGLHAGALLAKELGGSLTAESEGPGRGATFILELPQHTEEAQPEPAAALG